jgi:hypothetical protein
MLTADQRAALDALGREGFDHHMRVRHMPSDRTGKIIGKAPGAPGEDAPLYDVLFDDGKPGDMCQEHQLWPLADDGAGDGG